MLLDSTGRADVGGLAHLLGHDFAFGDCLFGGDGCNGSNRCCYDYFIVRTIAAPDVMPPPKATRPRLSGSGRSLAT